MCDSVEVSALMGQLDVTAHPLDSVRQATKALRGMVGNDPETYQPQVLAKQDFVLSNFLGLFEMFQSRQPTSNTEVNS